MNNLVEPRHTLLALLLVAVAGGLVCAALWLLLPRERRRLLPLPRQRAWPWSGAVICLAFCLLMSVPVVVHQVLVASGLFTTLYGAAPNTPELLERQLLWTTAFGYPAAALAIVVMLWSGFGVRPAEVGLTPVRLVPNVVASYLAFLLFAPLTLLLYWFVTLFMSPEIHPLQRVGQQTPLPVEWVVLVFSAVVAAPLIEELLFRGLLLRWQTDRPVEAQVTVALAAFVIALFSGYRQDNTFNPWPAVFAAAMLPGMFLIALLSERFARRTSPAAHVPEEAPIQEKPTEVPQQVAEPIRRSRHVQILLAHYSNAMLFAAFHSRVWPSPIALFPLGVGLAWLAHRTQSLIGPLVMHALFNSVACLAIILSQ